MVREWDEYLRQPTDPEEMGLTYMVNVHCVLNCDEEGCDFSAQWYLDAKKQAEEHHRETGHELRGEMGLAVWVGKEGQKRLAERVDRVLGRGEHVPTENDG